MTSVEPRTPVTDQLAAYVSSVRSTEITAPVVDHTRRVVLDTLGCMLLGGTLPAGRVASRYVESFGGAQEATVIGARLRAPAPLAALANGTAAHADELDGVHRVSAHPAAISVAAALAAAESHGATGAELIAGVGLSFDVGCGLLDAFGGGHAMRRPPRHLHGSGFIAVGAAAAGAWLAGLDEDATRAALGIAPTGAAFPEGFVDEASHLAKAYAQGQAAASGLTAVRLAAAGLRTNPTVFEARNGFADSWWHDEVDLAGLLARIRDHDHVLDNGFKYFSAGYAVQAPIALSLGLMAAYGIAAGDVARVRVGMTTNSADKVDAVVIPGICLQDMLALAMVRGRLGHDDAHDPSALDDEAVARLRSRIEVVRDPAKDAEDPQSRSAWVSIETTSGACHTTADELPPGHWGRGGMPMADVAEKFRSLATPRIGAAAAQHVIDLVEDLGALDDVGELVAALAGTSGG